MTVRNIKKYEKNESSGGVPRYSGAKYLPFCRIPHPNTGWGIEVNQQVKHEQVTPMLQYL